MDEFDEFSLVTKLNQQTLIHLLISIHGTKELVIETNLLRPLDKICSMSLLREHNCLRVQQLHIDKTIIWDDTIDHRIFFVRPTISTARKICELIRSSNEKPYSIIQINFQQNFFIQEFEKNGLYELVNFYEFNLTLVHLESDLFSLELPHYSPDIFNSYAADITRTLWQLQNLYGQIPTVFGIGKLFIEINKHFKRLCSDLGEPSASADQPISHMFVFDRRLDFASILLTGLTYESILNDVFSYNCGKIIFGEVVDMKMSLNQQQQSLQRTKIYMLNNSDPIFYAVRNSHMTDVFPFLRSKTKFLQMSFDRVANIQRVDEMKNFVTNELGKLKDQQKQLEMHICACEYILEKMRGSNERFALEHAIIRGNYEDVYLFTFIQKLISLKCDPWSVLQLASLWSIRANGIPTKYYQQLQEAFLHRYGFEQMTVLFKLRKNGLIVNSGENLNIFLKSSFMTSSIRSESDNSTHNQTGLKESITLETIVTGFQLCPVKKTIQYKTTKLAKRDTNSNTSNGNLNEMDAGEPVTNLGFVFSDAYIPLISYIVEQTVIKGWDEQHLKKVLGENTIFCSNPSAKAPDNRIRRAILVCFCGGVTYAEIASLRCFAQNRNFRLIILTTHLIHKELFLRSYSESFNKFY